MGISYTANPDVVISLVVGMVVGIAIGSIACGRSTWGERLGLWLRARLSKL